MLENRYLSAVHLLFNIVTPGRFGDNIQTPNVFLLVPATSLLLRDLAVF